MASTIRVWNGNQYKDHTLEQFGKTRIFIGSGSYCDIVIKAQGIEEQHGILLNKDGEWFYQDADSMSGTFMNGNRVSSQKLAEGNVLVFGELKGENTVCLEVKSVETKGAAEKNLFDHVAGGGRIVHANENTEVELMMQVRLTDVLHESPVFTQYFRHGRGYTGFIKTDDVNQYKFSFHNELKDSIFNVFNNISNIFVGYHRAARKT